MKALVMHGKGDLRYEDVSDAKIEQDEDIIVKMNLCGICGSDLHLFQGKTPSARPVYCIGHEAVGEVVETGRAISSLRVGDRVMLSAATGCGACRPCLSGEIKRCERAPAEVYGIGGPLEGCQAEAIRVPVGEFNTTRIPEGLTDEQAVLLTDNVPTAYAACVGAQVGPGRSVAVIGLGPIGLMAVELALVMGASVVYAIDPIEDRRERARKLGAVALPPDNLVDIIAEMTSGRMIDSVIEAVGGTNTVDLALSLVGTGRNLNVLGVDSNLDFRIPIMACVRGITIRASMMTEVSRYWGELVPMMQSGRIRPERLITTTAALRDGLNTYERCLERSGDVLKVMMKP